MKLCIRDDDTSFYTKPEDLQSAYCGMENIPVTFSVVPFSVSDHTGNHPYGIVTEPVKYAALENNPEIVEYLKQRMRDGKAEVVLHGIHHEYREIKEGTWTPETEYLTKEELKKGIIEGREYLERIFGITIDTFIPPSNIMTNDCAEVLDELGLNTNSIFTRRFERKPTPAYIKNYVKSNIYKLLYGGRYSGVMQFPNHKELCVHRFWGYDNALKKLQYSMRHDFSLVLYTHYWDLNRNETLKKELKEFTGEAIRLGAEPSLLSECFR